MTELGKEGEFGIERAGRAKRRVGRNTSSSDSERTCEPMASSLADLIADLTTSAPMEKARPDTAILLDGQRSRRERDYSAYIRVWPRRFQNREPGGETIHSAITGKASAIDE